MEIVNQRTGFNLQDASLHDETPSHTRRWLAATDPIAPPGRVRLQLDSMTQVHQVFRHIHGRAIEFGADLVSIAVRNDLLDAIQGNPGNDRGSTS